MMIKRSNSNKRDIPNKISIYTKNIKTAFFKDINYFIMRLLGFEPRTSWSVAKRSIQLSYRRIIANYQINC